MKIICTGGRDYKGLNTCLSLLRELAPEMVLVGDCPTGADNFVRTWCEHGGVDYGVFKADWEKNGKAAGPIRNKTMIDSVSPKDFIVIAFPGGRGTEHCRNYAKSKGFIILEVNQ